MCNAVVVNSPTPTGPDSHVPELCSRGTVQQFLRTGFHPSRRLGQSFLVNPGPRDAAVTALKDAGCDGFLEIGPGLGALTCALCRTGDPVAAVEVDGRLVHYLSERLQPACPDLILVHADALEVDYAELARRHLPGRSCGVAGNIPYSITSPLIFRLLDYAAVWVRAVLLVQREVAVRLMAAPGGGDYGALSVMVQSRAKVERVMNVSKGSFIPAPAVESVIVSLTPAPGRLPSGLRPELFEQTVRLAFQQRRKTLLNAISRPGLLPDREHASEALAAAHLDETQRPETLSLDDFALLALEIQNRLEPSKPAAAETR